MASLRKQVQQLIGEVIETYANNADLSFDDIAKRYGLSAITVNRIIDTYYKGFVENPKTITLQSAINDNVVALYEQSLFLNGITDYIHYNYKRNICK